MKFCSKCGNEIMDEAMFCPKCGCKTEQVVDIVPPRSQSTRAIKVWMIIGAIFTSFYCYLIPLAWCIPMTIHYFKKTERGERVSTEFKVCSLLFVSLIGGILMLCDKDC